MTEKNGKVRWIAILNGRLFCKIWAPKNFCKYDVETRLWKKGVPKNAIVQLDRRRETR